MGDQMKEEEMGDARGRYGREKKHLQTTQKIQAHMQDDIKMCLQQRRYKGMECFHMAQDKGLVVGSCEHQNKPLAIIKG